jgi:hypothetical protein
MAFLLNVTDSGGVHVPFVNVIIDVELFTTIPRIPKSVPTATFDGTV